MEKLTVAGETEVLIGSGTPEPFLPDRPGRARAAILTQPAVTERALALATQLRGEGIEVEVIGLPDRDQAKTLQVAESVYEALARFGLAREDTIIGVGGGSVTDLTGFIAGTWLRGVEAVYLTTTLLGAVDASIGGKTGVNLAGKNLVGVIWHPTRVVVDTAILEDLPQTLLREGMAEALKAGLIGDRELVQLLSTHGLRAPLSEVVWRAASVKAAIVDQDDREHGIRAFLNLGHTIGHAIEFASTLSHGESVALGTIAAAHVSRRILGFRHVEMVEAIIQSLALPSQADGIDRARVQDLLRHDKKRDSSGLRMVLLEDLERPVLRPVTGEDVDHGLAAIGI